MLSYFLHAMERRFLSHSAYIPRNYAFSDGLNIFLFLVTLLCSYKLKTDVTRAALGSFGYTSRVRLTSLKLYSLEGRASGPPRSAFLVRPLFLRRCDARSRNAPPVCRETSRAALFEGPSDNNVRHAVGMRVYGPRRERRLERWSRKRVNAPPRRTACSNRV